MQTVKQMLDRALTLLRDNEAGFEATTWSRKSLLDWLNEGLCQIAALRPDLFVTTADIPLKPGSQQELPEGYEQILSIEGTVTAGPDGTPIVSDSATVADSALLRRFKKKPCLASQTSECGDPGAGYEVKSFIPNPHNMRQFRVEPPVPAGASVEVRASVVKAPGHYTDGDANKDVALSCPSHAALLDWIMHRAYSTELESEYAIRAKNDHLRQFYASVNGKYIADSRMVSGYVLGREGTGDERSGAPRELRQFGSGVGG